jgi:hypothetical protein
MKAHTYIIINSKRKKNRKPKEAETKTIDKLIIAKKEKKKMIENR